LSTHSQGQGQSGAPVQRRTSRRLESQALAEIFLELGCEPDLKLFRNNVGLAEYPGGAKVRYGLFPGSADLIGILAPTGRIVSLEVKSPEGTLRPEQVKWARMVRLLGGFACTVRSRQEARAALDRARAGDSE
jgi:hypothetical protein